MDAGARAQAALRILANNLRLLRSELATGDYFYAQVQRRQNPLLRAIPPELRARLAECDRSLALALEAVAPQPEAGALIAGDAFSLESPTDSASNEEGIRESDTAEGGDGAGEADSVHSLAHRARRAGIFLAELAAAPGTSSSGTGGPPDRSRSRTLLRREPARRP